MSIGLLLFRHLRVTLVRMNHNPATALEFTMLTDAVSNERIVTCLRGPDLDIHSGNQVLLSVGTLGHAILFRRQPSPRILKFSSKPDRFLPARIVSWLLSIGVSKVVS